MKKLLIILLFSIFVIGCSNTETESKRNMTFISYDNNTGVFKTELKDGNKKILFTLKCNGGEIQEKSDIQKTDNCYYGVGDSITEGKSETKLSKVNFHITVFQNLLLIREERDYGTGSVQQYRSNYQVINSQLKEKE